MKRPFVSALAIVLLVLLTVGCKTDQEKIRETLEAYVEAVVVHRAPYHAYVHLDPEDKEHMSVESYATSFDALEPALPKGTELTVGDVRIKADRAESIVTVTPPTGEPQKRRYVLRRDGTKWRVWAGMKLREDARKTLDDARRLAEDGAVQEALEKLEEVASSAYPASRPEIIEQEAAKVRKWLDARARKESLDAALTKAMKADLDGMKTAEADLSTKITEADKDFHPRLMELREEIALREKQKAMESFVFEEVRARAFRDAWGIFREVRFNATNNTGRPLSSLSVRLELINEEGEAPLGTVLWQVVEDDAAIAPGAVIEVKREVDKAPEEWKGREVRLHVEELEFADGANDEG